MSQRHNYRTPDGIIHLWTQEEIDAHVQAMHVPIIDMPPHAQKDVTLHVEQMGRVTPLFEDDPVSVQEETLLTIRMLHNLLVPLHRQERSLDHGTVQDLLSRIDVMGEPLKELVQALEVKR